MKMLAAFAPVRLGQLCRNECCQRWSWGLDECLSPTRPMLISTRCGLNMGRASMLSGLPMQMSASVCPTWAPSLASARSETLYMSASASARIIRAATLAIILFVLQVLGPQHILDTAVQLSLAVLPWWPEWMRVSEIVCQCLRSGQHREFLEERVRQVGGRAEVVEARVKSLAKSCEGFAEWCWGTLVSVCADLTRMEDAVRAAVASFRSASDFSSREEGVAQVLFSVCHDDAFWHRLALLHRFVVPTCTYSSWLRGCSCHESQRRQGRVVHCQWAGCRAHELASRTEALFAELQDFRASWHEELELVLATTTVLSSLQLKLAWVFDEFYLIWQRTAPKWRPGSSRSTMT